MHAQSRIAEHITGRLAVLHLRWLLTALLAGMVLWMPGQSRADDDGGRIRVADARTVKGDGAFLLNARVDITLSSGAREALDNGVPLIFKLHIQTLELRRWYWDKVVVEHRLVRQLQFHPLSRTYLLKDIFSGRVRSFGNLAEALVAVGTLEAYPAVEYSLIEPDRPYAMRMRVSLDIESLPTPVRVLAYLSSAWDINTKWYRWRLVR